MKLITKIYSKINSKLNLSNLIQTIIARITARFPNLFIPSFLKFKILLISFMFIYSIFLIGSAYILYKSYHLTLNSLNDYVYQNMTKDIANLNWKTPIQLYTDSIPSRSYINYVYGKLGIINYNDYIFSLNHDTQTLKAILANNVNLQSNLSNICFADIINQHSQLFSDIGEELIKRVFKKVLPLIVASLLLGGVCLHEGLAHTVLA